MIELRRQRTRYDESADSLTVATPSCCCCCCCCIATLVGATVFVTTETHRLAKKQAGSRLAAVVAALAIPVGIAPAILISRATAHAGVFLTGAGIVALAVYFIAHKLANTTSLLRPMVSAAAIAAMGAASMAIEFVAVAFSLGLAWFALIPLGMFLGHRIAVSVVPLTPPMPPAPPFGPMSQSPPGAVGIKDFPDVPPYDGPIQ